MWAESCHTKRILRFAFTKPVLYAAPMACHPERSEGSPSTVGPSSYTQRVLRFAQDDSLRFLLSLAALSNGSDDSATALDATLS